MSNFNRIGEGYLISYRDPNLKKTMEVYEGVVDYLKNFTVDERDMTKYIIGTISNIDQPDDTGCKRGPFDESVHESSHVQEMIQERASVRSWRQHRRISVQLAACRRGNDESQSRSV